MANPAYADPAAFLPRSSSWSATAAAPARARRSIFGDLVLIAFLLAQCFDGVFTYVGVVSYGTAIEANPLIASLMVTFGHGTALMLAKTVAAGLGILLHMRQVHGAVAVLSAFYIAVAIVPWTMILFS
jgi:uncharacterized membrane protein